LSGPAKNPGAGSKPFRFKFSIPSIPSSRFFHPAKVFTTPGKSQKPAGDGLLEAGKGPLRPAFE
jgi:hypothetical protein